MPSTPHPPHTVSFPQDGVLPGDHKFKLDGADVREWKRTRGTMTDTSQGSTGSGFGGAARGGSAWSGFGGGGGGASGGEGEPLRRGAVVGGMRRFPGTKQQALRKNGVFKIAPQSKVLESAVCYGWFALYILAMGLGEILQVHTYYRRWIHSKRGS